MTPISDNCDLFNKLYSTNLYERINAYDLCIKRGLDIVESFFHFNWALHDPHFRWPIRIIASGKLDLDKYLTLYLENLLNNLKLNNNIISSFKSLEHFYLVKLLFIFSPEIKNHHIIMLTTILNTILDKINNNTQEFICVNNNNLIYTILRLDIYESLQYSNISSRNITGYLLEALEKEISLDKLSINNRGDYDSRIMNYQWSLLSTDFKQENYCLIDSIITYGINMTSEHDDSRGILNKLPNDTANIMLKVAKSFLAYKINNNQITQLEFITQILINLDIQNSYSNDKSTSLIDDIKEDNFTLNNSYERSYDYMNHIKTPYKDLIYLAHTEGELQQYKILRLIAQLKSSESYNVLLNILQGPYGINLRGTALAALSGLPYDDRLQDILIKCLNIKESRLLMSIIIVLGNHHTRISKLNLIVKKINALNKNMNTIISYYIEETLMLLNKCGNII
jgi:hypothetical protein